MPGLKWNCLAALPLSPKKTMEEHAATQAEFLETNLEPVLQQARSGNWVAEVQNKFKARSENPKAIMMTPMVLEIIAEKA